MLNAHILLYVTLLVNIDILRMSQYQGYAKRFQLQVDQAENDFHMCNFFPIY